MNQRERIIRIVSSLLMAAAIVAGGFALAKAVQRKQNSDPPVRQEIHGQPKGLPNE